MADSGIDMQFKVRQNAVELGEFMRDLDKWESDIQKKDEELKSSKTVPKKSLPPVRNQSRKKKSKMKKESAASKDNNEVPKRISSYDYNSWDSFNVEEELQAIDHKEEMEILTSSSSEEEDEMTEVERRLQRAVLDKDRGNDLFKEGKYDEAINCYTTAHQLDPSNAIMPANRAMALIKAQRYGAAEEDCTTALTLDSTYTKAYLRRGVTRLHLNKLEESLADYKQALRLEPANKQAQQEIAKLHKMLKIKQMEKKDIENNEITKAKVPLKRIHIDEIGSDSSEDDSEMPLLRGETTTGDNHNKERKTEQDDILKEDSKLTETYEQNIIEKDEKLTHEAHREIEKRIKLNDSVATSSKTSSKKPKVFGVPQCSMQLQADWKILRNNPQELFEYLKKINPKSYPKLFQQSIDSDMLTTIIYIYHDYYMPNNLPVISELQCLAKVQRFGMAVMFLSEDHKKVLRSLFSFAQESKEISGYSRESLEVLEKKYGV